jgi:phthiocerol/phenolphthiocerol synthesis type-I polyketide synthase E
LQEPDNGTPPDHAGDPEVLTISARTSRDLAALRDQLAGWLDNNPHVPLADVAHTLQTGRKPFAHRCAAVTTHKSAEHGRQLRHVREFTGDPPHAGVAMAFSGQGTQRPDLTAGVYRRWPVFRHALDELLDAAGGAVRSFLLSPGDGDRLGRPSVAQPAIFAEQWAFAQMLGDWGVRPAAVSGNSIGEYAAACAAGVFTPSDAAELLAIRGELCERLCAPGAMLAVAAGSGKLTDLLEPGTWVAVSAGNSRCTVSGRTDAIERLRRKLASAKIASRLLPVDRAYHSPLMRPAAEPFAQEVARRISGDRTLPIASPVTGGWLDQKQAADPAYWAHTQLTEPVRLDQAMRTLAAAGYAVVGVGQYDGQIRSACAPAAVIPVMPASAGDGPAQALLAACARLWAGGTDIDWPSTRPGTSPHRAHVPTYPFCGQHHWPAPIPPPAATAAMAPPRPAPDMEGSPGTPAAAAAATADQVPCGEIAAVVSAIFGEVLGNSDAGQGETFFELGGDSLTASQAVARIGETYRVGLSLRDFFADASILGVSRRIEQLMEAG